jgi:uncharacterized protein RhaS with RHS repeats
MRIFIILVFLISVTLMGCQPKDVEVTITYDRNAAESYPYTTFGDVAKIYYTIGSNSYVKEVYNHRSITLTLPAKTELRATFDKYVTDANGTRSTVGDEYYKVDSKNPHWKF